jgi:hypothetical protein
MRLIGISATVAFCVAFLAAPAAAMPRERIMCPMIYQPVCAITRLGRHQTFSNRCEAHRDRARIVHEGECRRPHR